MEPTFLQIIWFALIAILFAGYFVLEGFDFGVEMNIAALSKGDESRRARMLESIGPVWDGNQVWLLVGGASIFAAFPEWYATLFSGFYLALLLMLVVLIARVCAFKYRSKAEDPRWRRAWDIVHIAGGFLPALLWGVAFANIVRGVDIDSAKFVTTSLLGLLNPFGLLGGIVFVLLFWTHGTLYVALRTTDDLRADALKLASRLIWPTIATGAVFLIWNQLAHASNPFTWIPLLLAALALVGVALMARAGREGMAFTFSSLAIVMAGVQMFGGLFPHVMIARNDAAHSLTVANASSTPGTLTVMLIAVIVLMPIVLVYQAWSYKVFSYRIDGTRQAPATLAQRAATGYRAAFDQE